MNSYDTDEDFDELERYIIDNETTDDDDIHNIYTYNICVHILYKSISN